MLNLETVKNAIKKSGDLALRLLWKKAISFIKDICATTLTKVKKKIASLRTSGRN